MKKLVLLICLAVVSLASFGQTSGPRIHFDKTSHNFGEILVGSESVTCEFVFTNTGNNPLTITNAKSSCGCVVPKWTKTAIKPGAMGVVTVTYTSTSKATEDAFSQTVTIATNGSPSNVTLTVRGHVVETLTPYSEGVVEKSIIELGDFKINRVYEKNLVIRNTGTIDLNLTDFICDNDNVTVTLPEGPIAPKGTAEVKLRIDTNDIAENHEEVEIKLDIATDSEKTPTIFAIVRGVRK